MGETIASKEMHEYFDELEARLKEAIKIANTGSSSSRRPKAHCRDSPCQRPCG